MADLAFSALSICRHKQPDALASLDDDEKGAIAADTLDGKPVIQVVNEPGAMLPELHLILESAYRSFATSD